MDFVTHAAVGAVIGRSIVREPAAARAAMTLGALTALAPDADHALEWVSGEAYLLHHRTATHSLLVTGLAVVAAALWPGQARARRAAIVAAGLASHLFLDLLTPFGTALLWPFDRTFFALDGLPIVSPYMIAL